MVAAVGAGSASASAEQLTAKPQLEETAVDEELARIAAEFAEHGIASVGGLLGDLGTLLGEDLQRWLHGEEEPAEAEAEEEAPEAPHACPICCVQVEDHEEPASFACCQKTLYHAEDTLPSARVLATFFCRSTRKRWKTSDYVRCSGATATPATAQTGPTWSQSWG